MMRIVAPIQAAFDFASVYAFEAALLVKPIVTVTPSPGAESTFKWAPAFCVRDFTTNALSFPGGGQIVPSGSPTPSSAIITRQADAQSAISAIGNDEASRRSAGFIVA